MKPGGILVLALVIGRYFPEYEREIARRLAG